METILVTGSNGYIGSHAVTQLLDDGFFVIGLDNFHNSTNKFHDLENYKFYHGDIRNEDLLDQIMIENKIDIILHFGALISVEESTRNPDEYFDVNHIGTRKLINAAKRNGVKKIIFSSTAATYGNPDIVPIVETNNQAPINPYGESKLLAEKEIMSSNMQYTIFRYFNVAGSDKRGNGYFPIGKYSHIIPMINEIAKSDNKTFKIYGSDYETKDGTCIRDYIHVVDLVKAHIIAAKKMLEDDNFSSDSYNISTGIGHSVKEVFDIANDFHKGTLSFQFEEKRSGDPAMLFASNEKIKNTFNWQPEFNIRDMIESDFYK